MKKMILGLVIGFGLCCLQEATLLSQDSDSIRVANIQALRELGRPEPQGLVPVIRIGKDVRRNAEVDVWVEYARARKAWASTHPIEMPESEVEILSAFEEEVSARKALATALAESRRKVGKDHRKYSDEMQKVIKASWFKEYIYRNHYHAGWADEKSGLKLEEFDQWSAENIADHVPLNFATVHARATNRTTAVLIVIDDSIESSSEGAFWMRYGLLRYKYRDAQGLPFDLLIGEEAIPLFKEEVSARRGMLKDFDLIKDGLGEETLSSMEGMKKAEQAGFLREYVWEHCHQDSWEEPQQLKLEEFNDWSKENLANHQSATLAILIGR